VYRTLARAELMTQITSITALVHEYANGDKTALDRLLPLIYSQLRRLANINLRRENPGHTLQPTDLVHELYAKLAAQTPPDLQDRVHFLRVAGRAMRQILVDYSRTRYAQKRGGRREKVSLEEAQNACMQRPVIAARIDDALNQLSRTDPRKAELIEMRFFGGMTLEESALATGLTVDIVRRELRVAQAWLQSELSGASEGLPRGQAASP